MNSYIIFCALVIAAVSALETPEAMKPLIEECKKEFNVDDAMLKDRSVPLPNDKKCFHFCIAQKVGYMDKDGKVMLEAFKKGMGSKMSAADLTAAEECSKIDKNDKCLTAEAICNCMHKN